eukprot:Skav214201  [mRNA]  locus=scaffold2153:216374:219863:+ [translate_table: standard]
MRNKPYASWYSSWQPVTDRLQSLGAKHRTFELGTGRNIKWVVAWSFLPRSQRQLFLRLMAEGCEEPKGPPEGQEEREPKKRKRSGSEHEKRTSGVGVRLDATPGKGMIIRRRGVRL